jgi:hypothetical protein
MQAVIQYSDYSSTYEVYRRFRELGITHIMTTPDWVRSWQGEVYVSLLTSGQDLPKETFSGLYCVFRAS